MFTPRKWWPGLLIVLPAIFGAAHFETAHFENETSRRANIDLAHAGFEPRNVTVSGRDVHFTLTAALEDRTLARRVAETSAAVRTSTAVIEPLPPAGRWIWSIGRDERGFVLAGTFPSRSAAADVSRRIRELAPGTTVIDTSRPAAGAPAEFTAQAAFAARQATRLAVGSITVTPSGMTVTGEAASPEAALEVITDLRTTPATWGAHADASWGRPAAFDQKRVRVAALATTRRIDAPVVLVDAAPIVAARAPTTSLEPARATNASPADPSAADTRPLGVLRTHTGRVSVTFAKIESTDTTALRPIQALHGPGSAVGSTGTETRITAVSTPHPGPSEPTAATVAAIEPTRDAKTEACGFVSGSILSDGPTFDVGSAHLGRSERAKLRSLAVVLSSCPSLRIALHGHTDLSGSKQTNDRLSVDRAAGVRHWLTRHGISPERMSCEGFGSTHLVAARDATASSNRRVEIRVM